MLPWHALLAPLPAEAVVQRRPVTPPEMSGDPNVSAIAGWEQLSVDLSAAPEGLRVVLVLLDATGQPISASDHVLTTRPVPGGDTQLLEHTHDSLGGRLESDGTFNGTRWRMVRVLPEDHDDTGDDFDATAFDAQSSKPTSDEVAGLKALVAEMLRRAGTDQPPRNPLSGLA